MVRTICSQGHLVRITVASMRTEMQRLITRHTYQRSKVGKLIKELNKIQMDSHEVKHEVLFVSENVVL